MAAPRNRLRESKLFPSESRAGAFFSYEGGFVSDDRFPADPQEELADGLWERATGGATPSKSPQNLLRLGQPIIHAHLLEHGLGLFQVFERFRFPALICI